MRVRRLAGLLSLAILAASCGGDAPETSTEGPATKAEGPVILPPEPEGGEMPRRSITLMLPSTDAEGLRPVPAEIFATSSPVDQAKQVVGLLLAPPAAPGTVPPFPAGTLLRSVFLDGKGTAFVSLSREAVTKAPGGSSWELLAVSALAGTLQRSMPGVKRVQLLIEGQEIDTLTGHLDLRAPVSLDDGLVTEP